MGISNEATQGEITFEDWNIVDAVFIYLVAFCKLWNSECLGATTKISGDFGINRDRNYTARFYIYIARQLAGALLLCALRHLFCKSRSRSQDGDTTPIVLNLTTLTPNCGKNCTKFQQILKNAPFLLYELFRLETLSSCKRPFYLRTMDWQVS